MNPGKASKNLTDGLLLAMAVLALIGLIVQFTSFDGAYTTIHPVTEEEINVESFIDDPVSDAYLKLFIAFLISAIIGFGARKSPVAGILASVCTIVISMNYFASGLIGEFTFIYVPMAVLGLAGNIVYAYFWSEEKKVKKTLKGAEENSSDVYDKK